MIVLQVTLSYASDPDEQIAILPTMVYEIDQAYHAGPMDFATLAGILNPTPPSAITDIEVVWQPGSGEASVEATSGKQSIDFGGNISAGTDATGLANDATVYTMTVNIDGTDHAVSVVGSAAQTIADLITEVLADVPGADMTINAGDLLITSDSVGLTSTVSITDVDLLAAVTNFVDINTAVDGTDATYSDTVSMNSGDSSTEFDSDFAALEGDLYNIHVKGRPPAYTLV